MIWHGYYDKILLHLKQSSELFLNLCRVYTGICGYQFMFEFVPTKKSLRLLKSFAIDGVIV